MDALGPTKIAGPDGADGTAYRAHCRSDRHGSRFAGAVRLRRCRKDAGADGESSGNRLWTLARYRIRRSNWSWAWRTTGSRRSATEGTGVGASSRQFQRSGATAAESYVDATSKPLNDAKDRPVQPGFDSRADIVGHRLNPDADAMPAVRPNDAWRRAYPAADSDLDRGLIARDRRKVVRRLRTCASEGRVELVEDGYGGWQP